MTRARVSKRDGYMLLDVMLGLALMAGLLVLVDVGWSQYRRSTAELAATREAVRVAEDVLVGLQAGDGEAARRRAEAEAWTVSVKEASGVESNARWVVVRVSRERVTAELTGVARSGAGLGGVR